MTYLQAQFDSGREGPQDESEPTTEADVPSDGADEIGEAMIRDLPIATDPVVGSECA
jgi:hypothetical protein